MHAAAYAVFRIVADDALRHTRMHLILIQDL